MEEYAKRKERLKAMRLEATESGGLEDGRKPMVVPQSLSNPLIEASLPSTISAEPSAASRFHYYTDPMAAYSANKRSGKVSHQSSPDYTTRPTNPNFIPLPAHQSDCSADLSAFQTQGPTNPNFIPLPAHQSDCSSDLSAFQTQGPYYSPTPGPFRGPSPMQSPNPYYNTPQRNFNHWGVSGGLSPNSFPSNLPSSSPGFGQGNRPSLNYGQGRGYSPWGGSGFRGSPYHNLGRGGRSGLGIRGSPGSVQSDSRHAVSAELRPDTYYKKSMVEDPWKRLTPILWKQTYVSSSVSHDGSNSWLPESITSKKPRVSGTTYKCEPTGITYKSEPSLAEYLAASFNEAVNEAGMNDS